MRKEVRSMSEMVTVEEAAKIMRVTTGTVRRLIKQNRIKAKKVSGTKRWLIDSEHIKKILQ